MSDLPALEGKVSRISADAFTDRKLVRHSTLRSAVRCPTQRSRCTGANVLAPDAVVVRFPPQAHASNMRSNRCPAPSPRLPRELARTLSFRELLKLLKHLLSTICDHRELTPVPAATTIV